MIGCDAPDSALSALEGNVPGAWRCDEGLCVLLDGEPHAAAAAVNARLIEAGVAVWRLEPARHSLEQRFLEITSRVGAPA